MRRTLILCLLYVLALLTMTGAYAVGVQTDTLRASNAELLQLHVD